MAEARRTTSLHQLCRSGHGKIVSFIAAVITRRLVAGRGAEKQDVQSHREPEQDGSQQQPLCPCHRSAFSRMLKKSASLSERLRLRSRLRLGENLSSLNLNLDLSLLYSPTAFLSILQGYSHLVQTVQALEIPLARHGFSAAC
jgi:hypothetical protein